jgi:hypothetical protein
VEAGEDLAGRIQGARFVALDGADHLPFVGDTAPILEAIARFVAEGDPAPSPEARPIVLAIVAPPGFEQGCVERAHLFEGRSLGGPTFVFEAGVRALRFARDVLDLAAQAGATVRMGIDASATSAADLASTADSGTARVSDLLHTLALGSDLRLAPEGSDFVLRHAPRDSSPP